MSVIGVARQRAPYLDRLRTSGENGDPVPALLAVPDHPVAGVADGGLREIFLRSLQFLQADDIRCRLFEPAQQVRQAGIDAVYIEGRDSHAGIIANERPNEAIMRARMVGSGNAGR